MQQNKSFKNEVDEEGASASFSSSLASERDKDSARLYRILEQIRKLRQNAPEAPEPWIRQLLQQELDVSEDEADALASFDTRLGKHLGLLKGNKVSSRVVRALLESDEETRTECLARIADGNRLLLSDIERIRRRRVEAAWHPKTARARRRAAFDTASQGAGRKLVHTLETSARELLRLLDQVAGSTDAIPKAPAPGSLHEDPRLLAERIREKATEVAANLEAVFGARHVPFERVSSLAGRDVVRASIAKCWHVLRHLDALDARALMACATQKDSRLRECMSFLAGATSTVQGLRAPPASKAEDSELSHVDLFAGIGGASLGLGAAGFAPAAVFEASINARRILQDNRWKWPLDDLSDATKIAQWYGDLASRGVDVVTSGTLVLPFSTKPGGWDHGRETFDLLAGAVRAISPRAFFFGIVSAMMTRKNEVCRNEIERSFRALGYDTTWLEVDATKAGLPQEGPHFVLVGTSKATVGKFEMPVIVTPRARTLWHAIGNMVASRRYTRGQVMTLWKSIERISRSPGHGRTRVRSLRNAIGRMAKSEQYAWFKELDELKRFDEWLCEFRNLADRLAPPFILPNGTRNLEGWEKLGIDGSALAEHPPEPGVAPGHRLKLTVPMMAAIKGFPPHWKLTAAIDLPKSLVEDALPPIVAQMVGLSLYLALTGKRVDYEQALASPLNPDRYRRQIGPPPPPILPLPPKLKRSRPRKASSA